MTSNMTSKSTKQSKKETKTDSVDDTILFRRMVNTILLGHGSLRLVSWNTKGMNSAVKTSKILAHLRDLKADIMFKKLTYER